MKNNTILFDFLCINSLRRFANKKSFVEKNTITAKNIHKCWILMPLMVLAFLFGNVNVSGQTTVTYTMQTGNFNSLQTERNNNPPYSGSYNNGATELAQYANGGSFGNTPGAAAFQTFSSSGAGSGTARTLKVGDRFTVTCYVSSNPSSGGYIGISFRASTTYTNFFSATDASTVARFQLDNTGNWKVYSGSSVVATSSSGPNADRTFSIEITSSNTFNATIGSETFYDLSFGTAGPISSFSIYTFGDSNANSFWKNGSLTNFGHSAGDGLRFGYGLSGSSSSSISGIVSDGINTNSTATSLANVVRVGGASGTSVTLSGASTYTGATTVNANGTLRLGVSTSTSASGPLGTTGAGTTITSGGVLNMNGFSLTSTATESLTVNGTGISSGGALINSSGTGSTWAGTVALGSNSSAGGAGDLTLSGAISGTSTSFTKIGAGTLTLSGTNSMTGSWLVNEGTLSVSSFGNNTNSQPITLGASSTSGKFLYRSTGAGGTTTTVLTVAVGGGSIEHNSTSGLTFSQNATLNGTLTTNCSALAGNLTFSGVLSGNGGLTVNSTNTGETILSGANTYIGATTITAGTLRLNAADRISNSSNLVLNGGTFSTGATAGFAETVGTLQLTENSTILLGTGSHNLNFSASNSTAWTAGKTLTITGWTGTASGGTAGRIYVGSSGSGLTQAQLDAINFTGQQPGAQIISGTGEIVPNFTVTITSAQSGDWNSTSTWVGGAVPDSIDNVVIAAGHTVTVTAGATCRKVNFTGTGGTLTVNSSVTLTVTNAVAVDADANNNSSGTVSGSGTLSCGSVTIGSTITPNAIRTTSLTSTISTFTSSGSLSLFGRISASFTNNSSFNLQSGTFSVASISQATNASGCSTSILMNGGAQTGTLIYSGTTTWSQTGGGSSTTTLNGSGATVNYAASGNQTVLNTSYTNLTLSGSGNKTLAAFSISGTLSIQGSAVGITTAPTFGASSTLEFKNVGTKTTNAIEWPASSGPSNLIIDNSGSIVTMPVSSARTLSGNLTLTAGTLADAGNILTVQGNIAGTGSHTGAGSITMTGASKTISGATLTNLTLNNASGFTLNGSPTINGALTFTTGRLSIGSNTLNLAGTVASMTTSNNITGSSTSNISITGSGTLGVLLLNQTTAGTTNVLNNLTINRSSTGVVNLGSALNLAGNLTVTNGSLRSSGANTLTMAGTTQSFTISNTSGGSVLGTDNSAGNDLTLAIATGSTTTLTGDATSTNDDDKKFFNVTVNTGGTLVLSRGILCKYGTFAVNGTLQINANGYLQTTPNGGGTAIAPTYGSSSLLRYNSATTYGRGIEWSTTSGAGYPNNVQVSNNTTLNVRNGADVARQMAGNLTVDANSTLSLEGMTSGSFEIGLTVVGNVVNNGSILLATSTERLKCVDFSNNAGATTTLSSNVGGDLELIGSLIDNATFNSNNRAVFFTGSGVQDVSGTGTFNIDYIVSNKASGSIRMLTNLLVEGPNGGNAITLTNSTDILNLNGFSFTLGKATVASTISGNGLILGSSASSISILGTGALGTIRFDQTTPGTTNVLQNLTINRTSTGTVTLGNALTLGGNLTLTDGTLTVGGNTLTYAGSSIARTSGVIDASNANATLAFTNTSALTLPASLFSGNVNNLTMNGAGGVTLGSATTVAGVLNLSSGDIITSSTNTLTLSSTASITNGGSSSYIEGPLDRTLANGSNISYPIGGNSTNYRPLNLNSVIATGNPVVRVTVAETGATTVDGTTLESLLNSRNWRVEQISGTFTSATLVITESSMTDGTHEIGKSNNNQVGTYVSVGTPQTVSAGAITSPAGQGVGFYAIGVKASCTNPTAGGTIAETQTICSGGDPATFTSSVAASGNVGTLEYKWQYSSTSDFSTDINEIASSNAETYDAPSGLTATRYYRRLARVSCKADWTGAAESNILMVTVRSAFTTGEISSTGQTICYGGTPTEIGSTTVASGGDASITYSWRSSSDSYLATIDGATSATYTPPSGLTSTTSYRRYANDGTCNTTATVSTATWTVTVYDSFTSGTISSTGQSICSGGTPTEIGSTTAASGGDGSITYSWRSSSDSYSAAIDGATSATYTPPSGLTSTTSYRRYANDGTCDTTATLSTGTWTVTVFDTFTSGAIETTGETICNGGDPVTIGSDTDASGGDDSITYKWKANGVDIESTNSATYNPPSGLTTTTTYTRYAKDANCNTTFELSSGSYVVTVTAAPASAGNNGSILLCAGITLTETLLYNALTGSPAAGGTWSPTIPTSGSVAGTYTYTQGSSPCAVNTATVTVTDSEIVTWNGSWSPSAPTASTSAVIQSTYQTSESITACSLRVTSGATVVILSGTVSLNGPIIAESSNSFVTFNNNAILLQNGSGYVNTGNINYKKASSPIFRLDYTLWSSPLTADSQPIFSFSPQTLTNRFYTYNEATNFYTTNDMYSSGTPALNASSSFKVGRGYLIRSPNNWVSNPSSASAWTGTFTGVPNNGDISVAINRSTGDVYGYNAVGNPYPSPISIASFLSDNSGVIGSTLWFWRKTNGVSGSAYITYSAGTYSSGSQSVYNIQPGQGFFVRATSSGSLQFKNSQRVGTNGSFFRNNSRTTAEGEGRLWLNLKSNSIVVGNMALGYKEGATNDLDLVYDGEYLNDSSLALTSSLPGKELSVQHRAAPFVDTDVVPLSFKTDVSGTYSIDFNGTDGVLDTQDIYLEDLLLGQSVDIKTTPYTFASAAGTFSDRFRIVYINNALGTDVPVFNANQVVIYNNEINDFVINSGNVIISNIKVYDVRGRLLQEYKNVNDSETTINVGSVNQVLLVQITSEDGVMVTKKVIR